ncbi:AAA family ATPase [Marinitoga lauensis]|uniref:AAA family ATPase n=1 Tax=Marinitoga lauensis TaxID=2201189 RepID=UPI0010109AD5|nr:AAA family ATPase [Marinitoga lauensis]
MKINKIILKNYRNHKNLEVEFEKGINLLLGKNGSGKSSIFEALGIALFDIEPRDKNLKNAVNKEEKSAIITVGFTGNDMVDYIVERKIGNQSKYLLKEKSGEIIAEKKDIVLSKIGELAGIKGKNTKEIFKNVISAYQNDLVNIFNLTGAQRKELFNKIFNTEIYEKISSVLLNVERKYDSEINKKASKIELLESQLEEYKGLDEEIDIISKNIEMLEEELKLKKAKMQNFEKAKKNINTQIEKVNELEQKINKYETTIKSKKEMKNKLDLEIKEAEKAKDIVKQTKEGYDLYIKIEKDIEKISILEKELIRKEKEKSKLEKGLNELEKKREKFISEKKNFFERKKEKEKKIKELEDIILEMKPELILKKESYNSLLKNIEDFEKEKENFEKDFESYRKIIQEIKQLEEEIKNEEIIKEKNEEFVKEKEILELKLKKIKNELDIKSKLKIELEKLKMKLENLEKSKSQLSDGNCPILNEKCLNLEEKGGSTTYFDSNINQLIDEIEKRKMN